MQSSRTEMMTAWLGFFQRPFPSANTILVRGKRAVLVDSGFGSDLSATEQWLREMDVSPPALDLLVNTHYHSDRWGQPRFANPLRFAYRRASLGS